MKKHIVFDFDGTLVNTLEDIRQCVNHTLGRYALPPITPEQAAHMVGGGAARLCELAVAAGGGADTVDAAAFLADYKARYAGHLTDYATAYPGIPALLAELSRRGCTLSVITNKPLEQAKPILDTLFGETVFHAVWGDDGSRPRKPDAALMGQFLAAHGFEREDTVYIGDSDVDIFFAKNAGLTSIGVSWGFRGREELENAGADFIAEEAADILGFLE